MLERIGCVFPVYNKGFIILDNVRELFLDFPERMNIVRENASGSGETFGELKMYGSRVDPDKCIVHIPGNAPPGVKACIPEGAGKHRPRALRI